MWLSFLKKISADYKLNLRLSNTLEVKFPDRDLNLTSAEVATGLKSKGHTRNYSERKIYDYVDELCKVFKVEIDKTASESLEEWLKNEFSKYTQEKQKEEKQKEEKQKNYQSISVESDSTEADLVNILKGYDPYVNGESIKQNTTQIDWLDRSRQLLEAQKHPTTNNFFRENKRNLDDIHVPLALVERKERPNVKEEPSPEHGSQLCQPEYTEVDRFEHDKFLARVVEKPAGGKHIAIIGEPGAGKTTILTKICERLIQQAEQQPEEPLVVAWISLASLSAEQKLSEYFYGSWLDSAHPAACPPPNWKEELIKLVEQKRVWLLLDETSKSDSLNWLNGQLAGWGQNLRVVVTCRLNQWEAAAGGNALTNIFDVYRTLDYSYRTSQGDDQVKEFIGKWFTDNEKVATQIRTELDAPGKERIKDLVKNPLLLTLLCASWERGNQALPETQAGLYEKFVDYLYEWKAVEFDKEVELREELDLALGKLAKEGLNRQPNSDGAVRRFRFTTSEIRGLWGKQSRELLAAAKNLGWLNVVEKDTYAFYHPTFQEYFAACSIDDWDYFLPRAHFDRPINCQGEDKPTYRVFEQEWRQVILLWVGRRDEVVTDELKEEFIDKLTNFREQEGEFYYYRAYCMAAVCVGEFNSSRQAESIVRQVVKLAFGYFDTEKQKWTIYQDPIKSLATETIPFTYREIAIEALVALLQDSPSQDLLFPYWAVAEALDKIDVGNPVAIIALISLLHSSSLDYRLRPGVAMALGKIAINDRQAIDALVAVLLNSEPCESLYYRVAEALGKIAIDDRQAIDALVAVLLNCPLDDYWLPPEVTEALGKIAIDDRQAINALAALLKTRHSDYRLYTHVAKALHEIDVGNPDTISALVELLKDPQSDGNLRFYVAEALGKIDVGNPDAIATLVTLLKDPQSNDPWRLEFAETLGKIDVGNPDAISALIELLKKPEFDEVCRSAAAETLSEIAVGDLEAIAALVALLKTPQFDDICFCVAKALGKIDVGNPEAIAALVALLKTPQLDEALRSDVAGTLDEIDVGNPDAIAVLVDLLKNPRSTCSPRYHAKKILVAITPKTMPSVIWQLNFFVTDEIYNSNSMRYVGCYEDEYNSNFTRYQVCCKVLFQCAQTLSYSEFHIAWHQTHLPTSPFSPQTLNQQLNRPNTLILDIATLNHHTTPELAQELSNRIYHHLNTQPIPQIQNIPQLKPDLLNLKPHLALILYHPTPTPTLIQEIAKLHTPKQIQIIWLTPADNVPDGIRPDPENLVAAIGSAIDRFTEE